MHGTDIREDFIQAVGLPLQCDCKLTDFAKADSSAAEISSWVSRTLPEGLKVTSFTPG